MPLVHSSSKKARETNIAREIAAGKDPKQAVAIGYSEQRRAKRRGLAVGGLPGEAQGGWWQRNQAEPVLGQGLVPGQTGGRTDAVKCSVPAGSYIIPADVVSALGEGNTANGARNMDRMFASKRENPGFAKGGKTGALVPVSLSGGEYVVDPPHVTAIGNGDIDYGHDILDKFVAGVRKKHVDTLKKLPGPVR